MEDTDAASDPIPVDRVRGGDLVAAAKENYLFRINDDDRMTIRKQEKTLVLRVREQDRQSAEILEFARIFRLKPGLNIYKIKSELSGEKIWNENREFPMNSTPVRAIPFTSI